jgi:uncharacterized protein (TIGR00299 family) protein
MKIAYFDCASGISGDMTLGALVDAGVPLDRLRDAIDSLGLPGLALRAEEVKRHGFRALKIHVDCQPEHVHRHLHHIEKMIDGGRLTDRQKERAKKIFLRLGEAEAKVHGTTIAKVHFHEVGAADSIADIVGTAVAWDLLGAERLVVSPIPTGTGKITIAHGEVNVPAPATAELLRGVPLAECAIAMELTTPTGAAIVAGLADAFGPLPSMTIRKIGYGAGSCDLTQQANILRLVVGETIDASADNAAVVEQVCLLETNIDDAPGELIGYCIDRLWEAGALDVYTTAIQMKKNRPGVMLSALCQTGTADRLEAIIFAETGTLGIRRTLVARHILPRQTHDVTTAWGPIQGKLSRHAGVLHFSPEFESCRIVAQKHHVSLADVYQAAQKAYDTVLIDESGGIKPP